MGVLVTLHAHPDDEVIATGGVMAMAAASGHRVVLVTATGGERGEVAEGFLSPGESLGERRAAELAEASRILGVTRVESLGYRDSGMMGDDGNDDPLCFWQADVDVAAVRLAGILSDEQADVLTVYDERGVYGHPDHIQVHRVGVRAAEMVARVLPGLAVYEATMNRDRIRELTRAAGGSPDASGPDEVDTGFGLPESEITTAVDVRAFIDRKRAAMEAHASQITPESFFLRMPPEVFEAAFGTEWFRLPGARGGPPFETALPL